MESIKSSIEQEIRIARSSGELYDRDCFGLIVWPL